LFPTVDWPFLRVWLDGEDEPHKIPLRDHATAIEGSYVAASASIELQGTPTAGDTVGLSWGSEQYNCTLYGEETLEAAAARLADAINGASGTMQASAAGARITLTCVIAGANGNRWGVYGFVAGAGTEHWTPWWTQLSGGASPTKWRIELDFRDLRESGGALVAMQDVRKMRWTYAAELQSGAFERSEFAVRVSNWTVSGAGRTYAVAGPGSRRIEDDGAEVSYSGTWSKAEGPGQNYSGNSIHWTAEEGASVRCTYYASAAHQLMLGTRKADGGASIWVTVDGATAVHSLRIPGEDALVRIPLGDLGAGTHTVTATHTSPEAGKVFYFDFLEVAIPCSSLPEPPADARLTLATDWDTDHSICLAPERTAWMIDSLGFRGRANHYVGAMWFYELAAQGHQYASATLEFIGTPAFGPGEATEIRLGRTDDPEVTVLTHLHRIGETAETIAKAFELKLNHGYMSVRAQAQGSVLTIWARTMGDDGEKVTVSATPAAGPYHVMASAPALAGGEDGVWRTDLEALPRLNRAARDWHRSFFAALAARGLDAVAALSLELQHGDDSPAAGIAQRGPAGDPVWLLTPALQTNFSPASVAFWRQAHQELAGLMEAAGLQPYLQFGEVQWWYFRDSRSGMPFYDDYTQQQFQLAHGRSMRVITDHTADPSLYPEEVEFLPTLIGAFTSEVMAYVRQSYPQCRFEVLYPLDVNETSLNRLVNYPPAEWTPANLDCLKTESFGYTYERNLDKAAQSIGTPFLRGFSSNKASHLIGISSQKTAWQKEVGLAKAQALESIVLFALDQYCLVGYPVPLAEAGRRSGFQG
jgi:hypothetical protein